MILNDKTRYGRYEELDEEFTAGDRVPPCVDDTCMRGTSPEILISNKSTLIYFKFLICSITCLRNHLCLVVVRMYY